MERAPARRAARAGHPSGPERPPARRLVLQTPPRSAISASVPLGGERSFAPFAFSRKRSSANKAFEVDSASPRPKRKTQRGRTNRKKTSGTSHGLVQQRIASTLRTRAPSIMAIRAPSRVLRSKLCLEVTCVSCNGELLSRTFGPNHGVTLTIDLSISRRDGLELLDALKHRSGSLECSCRIRSKNENVRLARTDVVTINVRRISKLFRQL